ncbi:MAG: asparaginase [Bacteroidetes bacterium]|nr:asparaginase [Bacteroidota bacterium]
MSKSVLIIYTGGTVGMMNSGSGVLLPFDIENLLKSIPELSRFDFKIDSVAFEKPLDSSNVGPQEWQKLGQIIADNYEKYTGFVVLHGTDTMTYTASALSFMFDDLSKAVIFTGSQLPISDLRTDAKENILTAIELACMTDAEEKSMIPEVAIYFENHLFRGNRTIKANSENFDAFLSPNFPALAEVGIHFKLNDAELRKANKSFSYKSKLSADVALLKVFPGFSAKVFQSVFDNQYLKGLVLETYGTGNIPQDKHLIAGLKRLSERGVHVLVVTQCIMGSVELGRYATSEDLKALDVCSGKDITSAAAVTKMMHVLANCESPEEIKALLRKSIRGEVTV